jgi:hypothetical protein
MLFLLSKILIMENKEQVEFLKHDKIALGSKANMILIYIQSNLLLKLIFTVLIILLLLLQNVFA